MSDDETKIVLAIVGSRDCKDRERVYSEINTWIAANGKPSEIVSGGATGVDSLAAAYANEHKIPLVVFAADWKQFGRAAGPLRNTQIIAKCTHVLALPGSSSVGTLDTIEKARKAKKPCSVAHL